MKALVILLLLFPLTSSSLVIVEVQIEGETASNDYIKIYNEKNENIAIEGYKLRKRTSTGKEYSIRVFPKGSIIPKKSYFTWANSRDDFHLSVEADAWSTATIARNNSIALLDSENNIIDAVTWGENNDPFNKKGTENPGQRLIRKKVSEIYQNTSNNSNDFYVYPPLEEKVLVKTEEILSEETKEVLGKIDINNASLEELIKIVHIGEVRAEQLISLRPFYSLDDLRRVRGIGEKSLKDIKEQGLVWVDPELIKEKVFREEKENYYSASVRPAPYKAAPAAVIISIFSATAIYILKRYV